MATKVLFLTNSEYGQANVVLAVAYELALRNVEVHVASFLPLQKRLAEIQSLLPPSAPRIAFHTIKGLSHVQAASRNIDADVVYHPPGVSGALQSFSCITDVLSPWTAEEYHEQLLSIQDILDQVSPTTVIVESLLNGGIDVCKKLGKKYIVLSPNSPKDLVGLAQPALRGFWKYPAISTGFSYPVPILLILANIFVNVYVIFTLVTSSQIRSLNNMREKNHGLKHPILDQFSSQVPYILPALVETEFPGLYIPPNLNLCGPILLPSKSVQEYDPDMARWLDKPGIKTILINLGSHVSLNANHVRQLGGGIRVLLDKFKDIQVLWKVMADGEIRSALNEILDPVRMKVVDWLQATPYSIICHPNVVCSVHHGGANSFFEAVSAGVPHVVLPVWYDTYDYARRVECLEIGVFGSPTSAPRVDAEEFGKALIKVVGDESFARNAKMLADRCASVGEGRKLAADKILEFIE